MPTILNSGEVNLCKMVKNAFDGEGYLSLTGSRNISDRDNLISESNLES